MANVITLFEHENRPFDWQARDLAAMDRLSRAIGSDVLRATVRGQQKEIRAAQHVGVVRLGHRTIQILPKIYQSPESTKYASARFVKRTGV